MKDKKITFKYFSIAKYEKEEAYLRKMHQQGWKLVKISLRYLYVRAYIFEKCQPEDVIYRIDYDQTGGDAYVQMFADCGWEYLFDFDESFIFGRKKRISQRMKIFFVTMHPGLPWYGVSLRQDIFLTLPFAYQILFFGSAWIH